MTMLTKEHIHANLLRSLESEHVKILIENLTNAMFANQGMTAKIAELEARVAQLASAPETTKPHEIPKTGTPKVHAPPRKGDDAIPDHAHVQNCCEVE